MATITHVLRPTSGRKLFGEKTIRGTDFDVAYIGNKKNGEVRVLVGISDKEGQQIAIPMDADDIEQVCKIMLEMAAKIRSGEPIDE